MILTGRGRRIDSADRDTLAIFAEGFGVVLERTWLLERMKRSGERAPNQKSSRTKKTPH